MESKQHNWAGNITYSADNWHKPQSIEQLQTIIRQAQKLKVVGTRHSFSHIANTEYDCIELTDWNKIVNLNTKNHTVTVEPGVRYGDLAVYLNDAGFALHNMASLPHISIVGAISTATHGSGVTNKNLASTVTSLEFVTSDGNLLTISDDDERFAGIVVGLGAFGAITKITLKIEPTYDMRQNVFLNLPYSELEQHFETIMASGYSVSLFTDWASDSINQVWIKSRTTEPNDYVDEKAFFGATAATETIHPIMGLSPEPCTQQMGIVGAWYECLTHFRMEFSPSHGDEIQSEYFVDRSRAVEALNAINQIRDQISPHLLAAEIRAITADNLWMSPCYQQDCIAFHFTWKKDAEVVKNRSSIIEAQLKPLNARPHWGKVFNMEYDYLRRQYAKWDDFIALVQELDPQGKFRNSFLNKLIFNQMVK